MRPRRPQPRLHLHRETLRSLSAQSLRRVAGGTVVVEGDFGGTIDEINPCPRSNAWTAGIDEGYVKAVVCEPVR